MSKDVTMLSDTELLATLVGVRTARRIYKGSLKPIISSSVVAAHPRLEAARELVRRWLLEEIATGSALTSPGQVRDYLRTAIGDREYEVFVALFLDAQHRVLTVEEMFRGTLSQTSVYPREVVKAALKANAAAVIFAHNHPSGIATPSQADELLTRSLREALALVDVKVLDHFVIAGNQVQSFAERGLL